MFVSTFINDESLQTRRYLFILITSFAVKRLKIINSKNLLNPCQNPANSDITELNRNKISAEREQ